MRFVRSGNPCTRVRPRSRIFSASVQKRYRVGSKEFDDHRVRRCACSTLPNGIPNSYWQQRAHARSKGLMLERNFITRPALFMSGAWAPVRERHSHGLADDRTLSEYEL